MHLFSELCTVLESFFCMLDAGTSIFVQTFSLKSFSKIFIISIFQPQYYTASAIKLRAFLLFKVPLFLPRSG